MNCKFKSKKSPPQYKTCEVHCFRLHCRIFYRIIGAMPPSTPQIQILTTFFLNDWGTIITWNVVWYIYSKAQFVMIWSRCKKNKDNTNWSSLKIQLYQPRPMVRFQIPVHETGWTWCNTNIQYMNKIAFINLSLYINSKDPPLPRSITHLGVLMYYIINELPVYISKTSRAGLTMN